MTLGAVVLDWVQPNSIAVATVPTGLSPLSASTSDWRLIHVLPYRASAGQAGESHWIVDREGHAVPTDHWKAKRRLIPSGEIRVSLVAPAQSNEITPRQWTATQELVANLKQAYQLPDVIDDTLALPKASKAGRSSRSARP